MKFRIKINVESYVVSITSDSILLEVQILEYSISFSSSTRVPGYSKYIKKTDFI